MNSSEVYFSSHRKPVILVVDDEPTQRAILTETLVSFGYAAAEAANGKLALDYLITHADEIDVVLLDRAMPVMDGITLLHHIKADARLQHMPVVMLTVSDAPEHIHECIEAGAFYYLIKPMHRAVLQSIVGAAVRESYNQRAMLQMNERRTSSMQLMGECQFQIRTLQDAERLAEYLSHCFPEPSRAVGGLSELMINAVEHGNLGIGYEGKTELVEKGIWRDTVDTLQASPEHKDKYANVLFKRKDDGYHVAITDMGNGFVWEPYMHIAPERMAHCHGRGIAHANALAFDQLSYNTTGNIVTGFVKHPLTPTTPH